MKIEELYKIKLGCKPLETKNLCFIYILNIKPTSIFLEEQQNNYSQEITSLNL